MKIKIKGKKAVFLTITLLMFALILFSLSSLFIKQKQSENFFVQGTINRVLNLDASIQKSITDLFKKHAGISIVNSKNTITITESLPSDFSTFRTKLESFEQFVENEFSSIKINADIQEMPLNLSPKGILYTHIPAENKILIQKASLAQAYEIKFTFPQGQEGACPISWTNEPGDLRVKLIAEDVLSSCESEKTINPIGTNQAILTHTQGNIIIDITGNQIEISRSADEAYNIQTTIELASEESIVNIKMPEITTNISMLDFTILGEARFLT